MLYRVSHHHPIRNERSLLRSATTGASGATKFAGVTVATDQGRDAAATADGPGSPRVVFTDPQVAAVGHTLASAEAAGLAEAAAGRFGCEAAVEPLWGIDPVRFDDALDVIGVHLVGGLVGSVLIGFFADPAALGYATASGIPFEMNLIKNRYIHRTFIRPTAELREHDLKMKLNPLVESIRGRRVILVDDSIVRGTTMRKVVAMLKEAGATEVHLLISCPPILYPDYYGINTPDQGELIAATMSIDEICEYIGATSLHFLSYDGMIRATGLPESALSASCFTGLYPISIGKRSTEIRQIDYRKYAKAQIDTPVTTP